MMKTLALLAALTLFPCSTTQPQDPRPLDHASVHARFWRALERFFVPWAHSLPSEWRPSPQAAAEDLEERTSPIPDRKPTTKPGTPHAIPVPPTDDVDAVAVIKKQDKKR